MRWGAPGVALSKEIVPAHPAATVVAKTATRASRRALIRGSIAHPESISRVPCGTIPDGASRVTKTSQAAQKGPDARRRPVVRDERRPSADARRGLSRSAREACSLYVERATEGAVLRLPRC